MADLTKILRCPRCAGGLKLDERITCTACGSVYDQVAGRPVLVDFSESIFTPADCTAAPVEGLDATFIGKLLSRVTYGSNRAAARNLRVFIDELRSLRSRPLVLVIGGGTIGSGAEGLYEAAGIDVVGTDVYPSRHTQIICDGHKLPFADATFDGVVVQAVLEHVLEPTRVVGEIHRVLSSAGLVYAETPFIQQVHMGAYDFTRFTFSGHRWLFRDFDEIDAGAVLGPGTALLWSIFHYASGLVGRRLATLATAFFAWVRLFDRVVPSKAVFDAACGLYFLGRKSDRSLAASDMPAYYEALR